jgi:FtsP/CotA-like multicopper oxidase with cupredoxin domain
MSNRARIGLVVATLAVIVVAFVVLSPGGDDENAGPGTTATTPVARAGATTAGATTATPPPAADHEPALQTIRVTGGKPSGGVAKIKLKKGDTARIRVASRDTSDEIHLHGYDLKRDLKAGGSVRFEFKADAEGIFEIELEGAGVQIGELTVEP